MNARRRAAIVGLALVVVVLFLVLRSRSTVPSTGSMSEMSPPEPESARRGIDRTLAVDAEQQREASSAATVAPRFVDVVALDCDAQPLTGVAVRVEGGDGAWTQTDSRGVARCVVPKGSTTVRAFLRSRDGVVIERHWTEGVQDGEWLAPLVSGAWFCGVVRTSDGGRSEGISVIAAPEATFERTPATLVELLDRDGVRASTVDGSGRFVVCGLTVGESYRVLVGGSGYLETATRHHIARGEGVQLNVEVRRALAARVKLVEADGAAVKLCAAMVPGIEGVSFDAPTACAPVQDSILHLVSGIPDEFSRCVAGEESMFYVTHYLPSAPVSVNVLVEIRGYKSWRGTVTLAEPAFVTPQRIPLVSRGPMGTLRVACVGGPRCRVPARERGEPRAKLSLRTLGAGPHDTMVYALDPAEDGTVILSPVPQGDYQAFLQAGATTYRAPQAEAVHIGDEDARVEFDCSGVGCLELDARSPGGARYTGSLAIDVFPDPLRPARVERVYIASAPFHVHWLAEGPVRMRLRRPGTPWQMPLEATVARGRTAEISVEIGD